MLNITLVVSVVVGVLAVKAVLAVLGLLFPHFSGSRVERYCSRHTTQHELLEQTERDTWANERAPFMLCGRVEGQLLAALVNCLRAKRVLEIGCFTGYSALAMSMALPDDGEVVTLEYSEHNAAVAEKRFASSGAAGRRVRIVRGDAHQTITEVAGQFDLVFIDADKPGYVDYYEKVLGRGLLAPGGVIVVDNVLMHGSACSWFARTFNLGCARTIDEFNRHVIADPRVKTVMLPVGRSDGVSIIRLN
eukprot:m51a1_g3032 hypothetical protein (248) ;mRNA; f:906350-907177